MTFVNSSSNSELETYTSSENEDQPKNSGDDNAKKVLNKANDQINTHFQSLYAFVVFNFYLLCFLVNFCNSGIHEESLFGELTTIINLLMYLLYFRAQAKWPSISSITCYYHNFPNILLSNLQINNNRAY